MGESLDEQEPTRFVVPRADGVGNVRAYYIAKKIDVVPMFQKMYGRQKNWLEVDSLIVSFPFENESAKVTIGRSVSPPPPPSLQDHDTANSAEPENLFSKAGESAGAVEGQSTARTTAPNDQVAKEGKIPPYAVFFDYGAVVFINCSEVLQTESIAQAEKFCSGFVKGATSISDDFSIEVDEELETWSTFKANRLVLQSLDISNIRVISSVLGQSVALGHFEQVVDGMLQSFEKANSERGTAQAYIPTQTKLMFKILRESNTVLSEVIVKLGVLDRTRMRDTVWRYEKYFKVWEGLREEFEIDTRWDIMNTKTDYLQHNMRFFLELLHSQKSERLEWMIIVLISLELVVSIIK